MTESDLARALETAKEAARVGGAILQEEFGKLKASQIGFKGKGDYVTEIDRKSEDAILQVIRKAFPQHRLHAEESGKHAADSLCCWFVDPLDGTANYVQGISLYCVSIALEVDGDIKVAVVFHPDREEMFWAVRGQGAFLNGEPIHVSKKERMAYSMLASGFPWRSKPYVDAYLSCFKRLFLASAGIRRMGSAAIDLAYTACGRFDGFWEMKLGPWDIAAGVLLIEEAGGVVTDFNGGKDYLTSGNVVAGNPAIHQEILGATCQHLSIIE